MENMDYDGRIARLNGQRFSALKSGDAVLYAHSCNALGMIPEDDVLYSRGMDLMEINRRRFADYIKQGVSDSKRIEKKMRFRQPHSERLVLEPRLAEWAMDLAINYLRDGPNVSPRIARERLSKFRDLNYPVPKLIGGADVVRIYNDSVRDIIKRARSSGTRPV